MRIPFVDLKLQHESLKDELHQAVESVVENTAFVGGKFVRQFEENYASKYGVKHCIGVANGTDAIYISLKALGIGVGDEVITAANSWISTSEAITQCGAKPIFVDIDPDYYTINFNKIEEKITGKTRAIIPVHLFGQPAQIDQIQKICDRRNLYLIEDCAQAHFAEFNGQKVGTFGIASTFSFYPSKNLGAWGDAGAILTNDDNFARQVRLYSNHGSIIKHQHEIEGINSRMDGLQAAILNVKLKHITAWNRIRLKNAMIYSEMLENVTKVITPKIRPNSKHIFHLYVIRTGNRNSLQNHLRTHEVETGIHYATALPFLKAYGYLGHKKEEFPVSYRSQEEILSLPMFPELSIGQIEFVVQRIQKFFN